MSVVGLNQIVPSSVTGFGGTTSVSPRGTVTFTDVFAVDIYDVFDTTYDVYDVQWYISTNSATMTALQYVPIRGTTVESSTTSYNRQGGGWTGTVYAVFSAGNDFLTYPFSISGTIAGPTFRHTIFAFPHTSGRAIAFENAANYGFSQTAAYQAWHSSATFFDGIQIKTDNATEFMTGTIRIYGHTL